MDATCILFAGGGKGRSGKTLSLMYISPSCANGLNEGFARTLWHWINIKFELADAYVSSKSMNTCSKSSFNKYTNTRICRVHGKKGT